MHSGKNNPDNAGWLRFLSQTFPATISEGGRQALRDFFAAPAGEDIPLSQKREFSDAVQTQVSATQRQTYQVTEENRLLAGVPVRIFQPPTVAEANREKILLNFHGGGFCLDSGSLSENIPIAALTGIPVVSVLYRLAPEHPFPAAVEDALAVYRELLTRHRPEHIIAYGTSAGAILSAQLLARLQYEKLPLPAALGFFSGSADFATLSDSEQLFPSPSDPRPLSDLVYDYTAGHDPRDPLLSPLYGDLSNFPSTLCISGTRDLCLSQTTIFHRALLNAGVDARLVIYEGMPHAHWAYLDIPESTEAFALMANFFRASLTDGL